MAVESTSIPQVAVSAVSMLTSAVTMQNLTGIESALEPWDPRESHTYRLALRVQTIMEPIIVVIGIIGNVLATITLLSKRLRTTSCCLYLAAKCMGDATFLLALFVVWLYRVHAPLLNYPGVCQITVFLSYACSYTSVWLIVFVSLENYLRIDKPALVLTFCNPRRATLNIIFVFLSACVLYNFNLWTSRVLQDDDNSMKCMALAKFFKLLAVLNIVDLLLTLVVPILLVSVLVVMTSLAVLKAVRRKHRLYASLTSQSPRDELDRFHTAEVQVARFLLIVTLTLVVLHSPIHVIRLKLFVETQISPETPSNVDVSLQRLFESMFYMNFSANLFIYLIAGENFRRTFFSVLCSKRNTQTHRQRHTQNNELRLENMNGPQMGMSRNDAFVKEDSSFSTQCPEH